MSVNAPKNQKIRTIYVSPGEIAVSTHNDVLHSTPLGSCVAVVMYDKTINIGGMAHVMLPGKAGNGSDNDQFKYAANAIRGLLQKLQKAGAAIQNMEVCLVGGANVLKRPNDTIASEVAKSVLENMGAHHLKIAAFSLGGTERRVALFTANKSAVYYTLGNSEPRLLWNFNAFHSRQGIVPMNVDMSIQKL